MKNTFLEPLIENRKQLLRDNIKLAMSDGGEVIQSKLL